MESKHARPSRSVRRKLGVFLLAWALASLSSVIPARADSPLMAKPKVLNVIPGQ